MAECQGTPSVAAGVCCARLYSSYLPNLSLHSMHLKCPKKVSYSYLSNDDSSIDCPSAAKIRRKENEKALEKL